MAVKLWHCGDSRSLRPLCALEELGMDYELVVRYTVLEPSGGKRAVADDYARWFVSRLRRLDAPALETPGTAGDSATANESQSP